MKVTREDRKFLLEHKDELMDFQPTKKAVKAIIIEKEWHQSLCNWLKSRRSGVPPPITIDSLMDGDDLSDDIVLKTDCEAIPYGLGKDLYRIFDGDEPIVRYVMLDPLTDRPIILSSRVIIHLNMENGNTMKIVTHPDWRVSTFKKQLCMQLDLSPDKYVFYKPESSSKIRETSSVRHVLKSYPGDWLFRREAASCLPPISPRRIKSEPLIPHQSLVPQPVGLKNLGNTCFFNAAIQCVLRIRPLTDFILSNRFSEQINTRNPAGSKGRIASAFRDLVASFCNPEKAYISPKMLHFEICRKYDIFADYGQHDSQELLGALIDALHEDMNQSEYANGYRTTPAGASDAWDVHVARNSSPIVDLFHGSLYNSIECPKCGFKKLSREPFVFLSLPIPRRLLTSVTLEKCVDNFSECETLDGNNRWECEKCGKRVKALKKMGVYECSKVLIIHFKRFETSGYWPRKINTEIRYPSTLDARSITDGHCKSTYRLTGVVHHSGSLSGGHYTASVLDKETNRWNYYNDSSVYPIKEKHVRGKDAYILFYEMLS